MKATETRRAWTISPECMTPVSHSRAWTMSTQYMTPVSHSRAWTMSTQYMTPVSHSRAWTMSPECMTPVSYSLGVSKSMKMGLMLIIKVNINLRVYSPVGIMNEH